MYAIDEIEMMAMIVIDEIANDPWSWPTVSDDPPGLGGGWQKSPPTGLTVGAPNDHTGPMNATWTCAVRSMDMEPIESNQMMDMNASPAGRQRWRRPRAGWTHPGMTLSMVCPLASSMSADASS